MFVLCVYRGSVAQLVEQRPEEPCVAGSSPAGTTNQRWALFLKEKVPTPKELGLKLSQAKPDLIFVYDISGFHFRILSSVVKMIFSKKAAGIKKIPI